MRPTIHDKWDLCACLLALLRLEAGDALIVPSALCGIPILRGIPILCGIPILRGIPTLRGTPILPDPAPMLILPRARSTRERFAPAVASCLRRLELSPLPRLAPAVVVTLSPSKSSRSASVVLVTIRLR